MVDSPTGFATTTVRIIKERLADQLAEGIQYEKIDQWYEMTQFETDFEGWDAYLVPSQRLDGSAGSSLYERVPIESNIERDFVAGLEQRNDVKLYVKLPSWFTVPTPIGEYNPDWAIVTEDRDEHGEPIGKPLLYLVRETKSTTSLDELRREESRKITCGRQDFKEALGVDYEVVVSAGDLP